MDKLPDEILIKILSLFDLSSLKGFKDVCERWSTLIQTSQKLTSKFNFTIQISSVNEIIVKNPYPTILHSNLVITKKPTLKELHSNDFEIISRTIKDYEMSLRKVSFIGCDFNNCENFLEFLFRIIEKFVKEIEFVDCKASHDAAKIGKHIEWKHLEILKLEKSSENLLNYFCDSKLTKLELSQLSKNDEISSKTDFVSIFWTNQVSYLRELKVIKTMLELHHLNYFLKHSNLRKLELDFKMISHCSDLQYELTKLCHFKRISFKNGPCKSSDYKTVKIIIGTCGAIDELKFHKTSFPEKEAVISEIFKSHPHLEYLRLPFNFGIIRLNDPISFERLKTIEFEVIKYRLSVQRFFEVLKMCPNLNILRIFWVGNHARINGEFFKRIFNIAHNLEEIHIGYKTDTFEMTNEILQIIKTEGKSLRKLSTYSENIEEMRNKMKIFDDTGIRCTALYKNRDVEELKEFDRIGRGTDVPTCIWQL